MSEPLPDLVLLATPVFHVDAVGRRTAITGHAIVQVIGADPGDPEMVTVFVLEAGTAELEPGAMLTAPRDRLVTRREAERHLQARAAPSD